mmetsp:Transcript_35047/g.79496  ORF Transcript_35047/g.79496 Transcript_35047/m.79496 type:complete len:204 (+) Transcript_35047:1068-1679(+)
MTPCRRNRSQVAHLPVGGQLGAHHVLEPTPTFPSRFEHCLQRLKPARAVVVDEVDIVGSHLIRCAVKQLVARARNGWEIARLVNLSVELLAYETLAVVHIDVVLLGVRAVAASAPAGIARGNTLQVQGGVERRGGHDVVGDVRSVLAKIAFAREVKLVACKFREGLVEGGEGVRICLGLAGVIPLAANGGARLDARREAVARP